MMNSRTGVVIAAQTNTQVRSSYSGTTLCRNQLTVGLTNPFPKEKVADEISDADEPYLAKYRRDKGINQ